MATKKYQIFNIHSRLILANRYAHGFVTVVFTTVCLLCLNCKLIAQEKAIPISSNGPSSQKESDFYTIRTVQIPEHVILEVGGMAFLPNDKLAVSTRHGEVWIISNPYMKNGQMPTYRLFAQGLHEPLGLNCINGDLYLSQRSELTRLRDLDGDGIADEYKTIYSWPLSGNYHEYSYGPVLDKDGVMTVNLNLSWIGYGASLSKWRGWALKITPDGKMKPFLTGLRSPAGFGMNSKGDLFYAENQGDWVGSGSITHMEQGDFMGNPGGLDWAAEPGSPVKLRTSDIPDNNQPKYEASKKNPGIKSPSVWFPHTILGVSTSDILSYEDKGNETPYQGKMGPFHEQLFVGDQGQSKIMRVYLEKIKGIYQGMVWPFKDGFSSGILRMNWGADGSMFVGMTSRGWSSDGGREYGLQRLEWNGKIPFEMKTVQARPDGFEIEFTKPVDAKTVRMAESWQLSSFTYQYHHDYGSPAINVGSCPIKAIEVSADHLKVRLVVDSMKLGYIHEIRAPGVESEDHYTLLHSYGFYTLNQFPDGEKLAVTDANRVKAITAMDHTHMSKSPGKNPVANTKVVSGSKHPTKKPADWTNAAIRNIVIGTKPGLKFDMEEMNVRVGEKIKLTFHNNDDMLHNLLITKPGTADKVGEQSLQLGINGEKMSFVPNSKDVLYHTIILHPRESDTIYFVAPSTPGVYPFICSYPGHYLIMRGVIKVNAR